MLTIKNYNSRLHQMIFKKIEEHSDFYEFEMPTNERIILSRHLDKKNNEYEIIIYRGFNEIHKGKIENIKVKSLSEFQKWIDETINPLYNNPFVLSTNGANRMTINSNGHATIGNTNGAIVVYDPITGTKIDVIDTIKELTKRIEELENNKL